SVAFGLGGLALFSGSDDGTIRQWDPRDGVISALYEGETFGVLSLAYHPAGGGLAAGHFDGQIRLWDVLTRQEVGTLGIHQKAVFCIAYSSDGNRFVSGSMDGTVQLWEKPPGDTDRGSTEDAVEAVAWPRRMTTCWF